MPYICSVYSLLIFCVQPHLYKYLPDIFSEIHTMTDEMDSGNFKAVIPVSFLQCCFVLLGGPLLSGRDLVYNNVEVRSTQQSNIHTNAKISQKNTKASQVSQESKCKYII